MRLFSNKDPSGGPPETNANDAELLAALTDGHVEALRLLHLRHATWLRERLARRCADPDIVDAAVQDTFVAIWKGSGRYRRRGPLHEDGDAGAWIWTIAIRKLISLLRAQGARRGTLIEMPGYGEGLPGQAASAEELVLVGVEHGDLGQALQKLAPELRAVIQATVLDGLTAKETSVLLGIPEGTVKTRVRRAKAQLREQLT
ncbi:RNA polymerase sigma factor [Sinosporangium siamense]|uniref:RNA polymerase sigma24 factor n=1 Tax=Sinosporangium siamense TaxID=1367973 RepID=A0A919V8S9_9ACTN|nr:RNA polymerase sigma factor [Sinosporangium siamense]GII94561.1 RNA polymerase sigma24 factor [Sinosporangium siamense]